MATELIRLDHRGVIDIDLTIAAIHEALKTEGMTEVSFYNTSPVIWDKWEARAKRTQISAALGIPVITTLNQGYGNTMQEALFNLAVGVAINHIPNA